MNRITVKQLKKFCLEEMKKGNGDKEIVISDDEEGNGFHGLYYAFTSYEKMTEPYKGNEAYIPNGLEEGTIVLG